MATATYTPPDSPLSAYTLLDETPGYTIRALTSADIPSAIALSTKLYPTSPPPSVFHFTRLLTHPTYTALLAFSSSAAHEPVGLLTAARHDPTNDLARRSPLPTRLDVLSLGVLPTDKYAGIDTRLVLAAARVLGAESVRAEVRPEDEAMREFWKGFGFEEEVEVRPWVAGLEEVVRFEGRVEL